MKFVDKLLGLLSNGVNFIGDMLYNLLSLVSKPLSYVYYFFDGVFYFIYQLFAVVVSIIKIFVALVQFFGALVIGFVRTIAGMLSINFSGTPINYPSKTADGMNAVMDVIDPIGLLNVVPLILIAVTWGYFVKKIIGLLGGEIRSDA